MHCNRFKKISIFLLLAFTLGFSTLSAQRIAYVDVNQILETIQEYQDAQKELDQVAARWRQEISKEYDKIKGLYNRYQAEQVLLSDKARKDKEDEIMNLETKVREMQKEKFGPEGELFNRRQELVQPIQDRVYSAIEEFANDKGFDFIFDVSSTTGLIFYREDFDKTQDILRILK